MGIMSAELAVTDLRIQKRTLDEKIYSAYETLSYLVTSEVHALDLNLSVRTLPSLQTLQKGLVNNHTLALREKEIEQSSAVAKSVELTNYPDVNLIGAYSYRENFDNYWTFGLGVSLPIYGTEDSKEEEARRLTLVYQSLKEDTKHAVNSELKGAYVQMKSAYDIYHLVHDDALPQVEHMFELTSASIATGGDLFKYIDILVQKLKLEQRSISAVADYNQAYAKIAALSGELK
jgi:outer membrane protein TolC